MTDLDRQGRLWRVREGTYYVFHLEPPLDEDAELAAVLAEADARYPRLREVLDRAPPPVPESEELVKVNYWLHADLIMPPADVTPPAPAPDIPVATGQVTPAGIHFAQKGLRWEDRVSQMTHEEIHAMWMREVGGAPLLGEGVAFWFELQLSARDRLAELPAAWTSVIDNGLSSLRELALSPAFWSAQRRGLPVYGVAGGLVGYLVEAYGLPLLKEIFQESHYEDDNLVQRIEERTALTLEELEVRVGAARWRKSSAAMKVFRLSLGCLA